MPVAAYPRLATTGDGRIMAQDTKTGDQVCRTQVDAADYENLTNGPRAADWQPGQDPTNHGSEARTDRLGRIGGVSAIDPATGEALRTFASPCSLCGGPVVTNGCLVLAGDPDGHVRALDAGTGDVLSMRCCPPRRRVGQSPTI